MGGIMEIINNAFSIFTGIIAVVMCVVLTINGLYIIYCMTPYVISSLRDIITSLFQSIRHHNYHKSRVDERH